MRPLTSLFVGLAASLMVGGAAAQSLKSLRAQASEEEALAEEGDYTAGVCGGSISTEIDWDTVEDWPEDESIAAICGGALSALESMCRAGAAPDVDSFTCAGDGSGPDYSGGELSYGASPGGDAYDETMEYLEGL